MSLKIEYSEENNYLIRIFNGTLEPNDIISAWEYLIDEKLKKKQYIGVISDYTNVELDMELDDFDHLLDLFKKNSKLLENIKLAMILETHINKVFPLLTLRYSQFNIRSFPTLESAKNWILE